MMKTLFAICVILAFLAVTPKLAEPKSKSGKSSKTLQLEYNYELSARRRIVQEIDIKQTNLNYDIDTCKILMQEKINRQWLANK